MSGRVYDRNSELRVAELDAYRSHPLFILAVSRQKAIGS
jgi:hypothetical protein